MDKKELLKDLFSYIFFLQSMPLELKKKAIDLIAANIDNEKLLQELHDKFQTKIEADDVEGIRKLLAQQKTP